MKRLLLPALAAILGLASSSRAENPIVQTLYTTDPAPVVINNILYVFTGHDEGGRFFTMHDWRCYSTTDMVNWTDHGCPLSVKDFTWAKDDAWAGQVIERNKKFYYFVPMTPRRGGDKFIGVAVSDKPEGPYKDAIGKPLIGVGNGNIDPTQFIDDDGQAYLYWGNPALKYVKLNEDMISFDQKVGIVTVPLTVEGFGARPAPANQRGNNNQRATLYEEGPWFYKRNNLYYMVYAASGIPENICYATSPNATGPWTFKGIIMPTEGKSFTNHPGVIDYKGHSYFFYHNGALPGGGGYTRSVCIEEFKYNADGTFPTIHMTEKGPAAIGHLDPFTQQEAATICWEKGVKTVARPDKKAGVYVAVAGEGAYIKVASIDFGNKSATRFLATIATATEGNAMELHLDNVSGELLGTLHVKPTGAEDQFEVQSANITGPTGIHDLYLKFTGSTPKLNFDSWKFE